MTAKYKQPFLVTWPVLPNPQPAFSSCAHTCRCYSDLAQIRGRPESFLVPLARASSSGGCLRGESSLGSKPEFRGHVFHFQKIYEHEWLDRKVYVLKNAQLGHDNSYHATGHVKKGTSAVTRGVGVRSLWCPKASVLIQGLPTGVALALKMRPTTMPLARTSKSSSFHSPDGRLIEARLRSRAVMATGQSI